MHYSHKNNLLFYSAVAILWFCSCTHSAEKKKPANAEAIVLTAPKVTVIANLADSNKPKEVFVEKTNQPQTVTVPTSKGGSYIVKSKTGDKKIELLPPAVNMLPKDRAQGKCNFSTLTTDNGLALDAIICIYRDKSGNLWFGTDGGGVSCYNGKYFANYTTAQGLANNNVYCITEDRSGNMWFGTDGGGASRYDGRVFTNYTTAQGLANNEVMSISEDRKGNLWFATYGGGVSRYDGNPNDANAARFINYTTTQGLANNNVKCIAEDKNGNMWFGTHGGGISCYDGKNFTNYTTAQGLANNSVRSMALDKNGDMWFGTDGGGVSRYDGKKFVNYTTEQGLANNTIWSINKDKNGNLWFGTYGGGASCYPILEPTDSTEAHFTNYTTAQGLASNNILTITEDKSGNLWFGTDGAGASRYDGVSFTNYTTNQGLPNNDVRAITEDDKGDMWFGSNGGGVSCYNRKSFTTYTTTQGLANDNVVSVAKDKNGNLWFGTNGGGVSYYNGKSFTNYTSVQGLAGNNVLNITEDKNGNIWFGTAGAGVSCYNGKSFITYTTAQGLANNNVVSIMQDKDGNMWFGTYGGGVSCYNGKSFTNYTSAQGLGNDNVLTITEDKSGNLWFGTDGGGVSRYDKNAKEGSSNCFITYTVVDGLPDNTVTQVQFDGEGNIIMGTNLGIAILKYFTPPTETDPAASDASKTMKNAAAQNGFPNEQLKNWIPYFEIYNNTNGYPVKDVNSGQNTIFKDSKGILWIATGSDKTALVRFDPSGLNKNFQPLPTLIEAVKINEENVCWYNMTDYDSTTKSQQEIIANGKLMPHDMRDSLTKKFSDIKFAGITKFYPIPQQLELPYNHNNITFDFVAIETGKNFLVRYQYILDGYTKEWSPITDKTSATFGNIREGTYTFRLKARSPEGIWSELPLTYIFKVLPPWYRTWWMYLIYALTVVFVVWQIVLWNVRRLQAKAKELEEEVRKATVEIVNQKKIVEEKNKDITDSITYAKRLQDAILPPLSTVSKYLPESFILYKPKDIVAGDFYWLEKTDEQIFIAACDCTGHGVPGAMVSMVCSNALNSAVNEFKLRDTGKLLDKTKELVLETFGKSESEVQDGMDISLASLTPSKGGIKVQWSGANIPLWYVSKGELQEVAPDKQPVGKYEIVKPFTTQNFELQKGDILYLFTDGYADQFGGPKGKKFKYKQLQEKLLDVSRLPMVEQKLQLEKIQAEWRGKLEQVDDLLIIGIKL